MAITPAATTAQPTSGYMIFHLNLAFSSIKTELRPEVIRQCYWPLLRLAQRRRIPIGIELTGWTLARIHEIDPGWVQHFAQLLQAGQVELVGSGWSQAIGPLMPPEANRWNQRLGLQAYEQLLGVRPAVALVNEMAYSSGLVDIYAQAGYRGLMMDRDNVRLALGLASAPMAHTPTHALGASGAQLPMLWADSTLFQSLQRFVHGDKTLDDYTAYVRQRAQRDGLVLPIYANDAEIFDFRPGRFKTEAVLAGESEWARLDRLCGRLEAELGLQWLSPSGALAQLAATQPVVARQLSSVAHPIPVKKQAKYNLNRWSVSGRDDLWLNSRCHAVAQALQAQGVRDDEPWQALCEAWASDLRTHITDARWADGLAKLDALHARWVAAPANAGQPGGAASSTTAAPGPDWQPLQHFNPPPGVRLTPDADGIYLQIDTPQLALTLNLRRGLAIDTLGFASRGFKPVIGTLSQGYFDSIELGADFYSGGVVMEVPGKRERQTDLNRVAPELAWHDGQLLLRARLPLADGTLEKTIAISLQAEQLQLGYAFNGVSRPLGTLRVAQLTLCNDQLALPLTLRCQQGGPHAEAFVLDQAAQHGVAASTLVSSTAGFGATDGRLHISDTNGPLLTLTWNPAACAAVPMLTHQIATPQPFTRLKFSLCELDDTSRDGGRLLPFVLTVSSAAAAPFSS